MSTISQIKEDEKEITIGVLEAERYNITEDEMLSMLTDAGDIENASELMKNSSDKGEL